MFDNSYLDLRRQAKWHFTTRAMNYKEIVGHYNSESDYELIPA